MPHCLLSRVGIGIGVDALHHTLQGGAGAYLYEFVSAVGQHVLHCGMASTFW